MHGNDFRLVTIHGIEKFNRFKDTVLNPDIVELNKYIMKDNIYIGKPLALKLDLDIGDAVMVVFPERINIFTGLPDQHQMVIGGIFRLDILDYDQKHIFTHYSSVRDFLPDNRLVYYLHQIPGEYFSKSILPDILVDSSPLVKFVNANVVLGIFIFPDFLLS